MLRLLRMKGETLDGKFSDGVCVYVYLAMLGYAEAENYSVFRVIYEMDNWIGLGLVEYINVQCCWLFYPTIICL